MEESLTPLSGLGILIENSDEVSESEFLNASDTLENGSTVLFLDEIAYFQKKQTATPWKIIYTNNQYGTFSTENGVYDDPRFQLFIQRAREREGQIVIGSAFRNADGNIVSPVGIILTGTSEPCSVVGILNYDLLVSSLYTLYIPDGLYLRLYGRFLGPVQGFQPILDEHSSRTIHTIDRRTICGGTELLVSWEVSPTFLGGPPRDLAWFVLLAGMGSSIAVFFISRWLLRQNQIISMRVHEKTAELEAVHESLQQSTERFELTVRGSGMVFGNTMRVRANIGFPNVSRNCWDMRMKN